MEQDIMFVRSGIEDLAFPIRSLRESDEVRRQCCIEHDFAEGFKIQTITGTEARVVEVWSRRAEFRAAEKHDEGMALKIRTRAGDMPDSNDIYIENFAFMTKYDSPGLFTSQDPPPRPSIKGGKAAAHEAVVNYREWAATKSMY